MEIANDKFLKDINISFSNSPIDKELRNIKTEKPVSHNAKSSC